MNTVTPKNTFMKVKVRIMNLNRTKNTQNQSVNNQNNQ